MSVLPRDYWWIYRWGGLWAFYLWIICGYTGEEVCERSTCGLLVDILERRFVSALARLGTTPFLPEQELITLSQSPSLTTRFKHMSSRYNYVNIYSNNILPTEYYLATAWQCCLQCWERRAPVCRGSGPCPRPPGPTTRCPSSGRHSTCPPRGHGAAQTDSCSPRSVDCRNSKYKIWLNS